METSKGSLMMLVVVVLLWRTFVCGLGEHKEAVLGIGGQRAEACSAVQATSKDNTAQ